MVYLLARVNTTGAEYEIIRALRDIDEYEMYPGQRKLMKATGQPMGKLAGYASSIPAAKRPWRRSNTPAIQSIRETPPFLSRKKAMVNFHPPLRFDRFLPTGSKVSGRIVMEEILTPCWARARKSISTWVRTRA